MVKPILSTAWKNIRRRPVQNLLVGSSLMVAAILFSPAVAMIAGIQKPFDTMFDRLNASHLLLQFDYRDVDSHRLQNWLSQQDEVVSILNPAPTFATTQLRFQEEQIDKTVLLVERQEGNIDHDQIVKLQGGNQDHPAPGEIWIPKHLAQAYSISLGDSLKLPTGSVPFSLVVEAIVVDPHFNSGLMNPTRAWVSSGTLPYFAPITDLHQVLIGIRLRTPEDIDPLWSRLHDEIDFFGNHFEYSLFKSVFMSFYQILAVIMLVFAILSMIIAMMVIHTTQQNVILSDYRNIGILKSIGFTPGNVVSIYMLTTLLIALISFSIAAAGSYGLILFILRSMINTLGMANLDVSFIQPILFTLAGLLLLTIAVTWQASRKAGKTSATEALRSGQPRQGVKRQIRLALPLTSRIPIEAFLGSNWLVHGHRRVLFLCATWTAAVFVLVFAINIGYSFSLIRMNPAHWGLEKGDILLTRNPNIMLALDHEALLGRLRSEPDIQEIVSYSYETATILANGFPPAELVGRVYDENPKTAGLDNLTGNHPKRADEISLCIGTSEKYQKLVGDSIQMLIQGQIKHFTICGIYQDISNLGQGFRLSTTALNALNPLHAPVIYTVQLKTGVNTGQARIYLQKLFGETVVVEKTISERENVQGVITNMKIGLYLLASFFLLTLTIAIFNDTLLSLKELVKELTILGAIGWTPSQILITLLFKNLAPAFLGISIGIPLALLLGPTIMGNLTSGVGIVNFPQHVNNWSTFGTIPGLFLLGSVITWMSFKFFR